MAYAKINVLIVTYKQADTIGRNIESILRQKEYGLNEIVICDDCSPDNNWEVIQSYVERYPGIIRAYRNNPNLGIYGNSNKLITLKGDADLYSWIEGDDAMCNGFLKAIQENITLQNINLKEPVGIFGDWKSVSPDGREIIYSNKAVIASSLPPFSLYIRNRASWRGAVFSKAVMDKFEPVVLNKGLNLAEELFDSQFYINTSKAYHIDVVGTIYYSNIGISTVLDEHSSYRNEENVIKAKYMMENFAYSEEDKNWLEYKYYDAILRMTHRTKWFYKTLKSFLKCFRNQELSYRDKAIRMLSIIAHWLNIHKH